MQCRDRRFRETTTKSGLGPTFKVTSSVVLWTSTRELRNFRGCHPCNRIRETTTKSGLDRPLKLLVQLCIGLRRENLEIFVDAIHGSISGQLIQIYGGIFDSNAEWGLSASGDDNTVRCWTELYSYYCSFDFHGRTLKSSRMPSMQCRESRLRETTTNTGLGLTFPVTTAIVLWTSTRELRNFRGCHPCKHKCRVEMVAFERRRQSRVLDPTFQLLLQLCFGLRRENLEIFADAIHASINEQLIQIHDGIFGFRLKCRVGILGFEKRRQSQVLDRPLQLLVQLSFGLRRENLEIFADVIHASANE
ncbi:LOW QUALITY PROTEIN: uncharacterized protein V1477_010489 [Vespula maculifrons]|uniref:Uncharacterized protein n=1 Tax=Vespula maculifrons TaxID=7453 RepID=A0ABD2C4Q4_VESMC